MKRLTLIFLMLSGPAFSQGRGQAPPPTPRAAAPADFTGYWVSVVSEDRRWRMVTPARGDFASIPLNAEGRRVGLAWDPAKDEAAGEQCRPYGAAAIMRRPGRLHITWQDDTTLRIDTDEGTQTRLFHFDEKAPADSDGRGRDIQGRNWKNRRQETATPPQA